MREAQSWRTAVVILLVATVLVGCAPDRDMTVPMPLPTTTPSDTAPPTVEPDPDPTMLPGGTALANRKYFDFVNNRLLAVNSNPAGRAIIDNLVAAGFDKSAMQVTPDTTSQLRLPADSIEFSVRLHDDCLIGQFIGGKYFSTIGPMLTNGSCLIGDTRPIDW
ncbi:hypothetical protein GCM10022239_16010 [Leifsonia bigeumensis]|uniref:DUF6993 domain-containing protein n=1 Tax=Leifsonella bigeumensis TaxID=433643 RepID=A0ABP7FPN6_9MICO